MASLVFLLFLLYEASSGSEVIQVEPGQDVTLPCDTGDASIRAAEWTRSDPQPSKLILFWRNGHIRTPIKGRVQLVGGKLKTGDVSLLLKNVSRDDNGTYECRLATAGSRRKKRDLIDSDPISRVRLQVTGDKNGDTNGPNNNGPNNNGPNNNRDNNNISTPLRVGLGAAAGVLVCSAVVGLFLFSKSKRQRDKKPEPSAGEETGGVNLL